MYSQSCSNGSNNIHSNFPALMNDGRNIKQNIDDTYYENVLKSQLNIKNNTQYRNYLQTNADQIILNNQLVSCNQCGYNLNNTSVNLNSNPYIFNSILDREQPYGYVNSDLKNIYLSKQQLNASKKLPQFNIN